MVHVAGWLCVIFFETQATDLAHVRWGGGEEAREASCVDGSVVALFLCGACILYHTVSVHHRVTTDLDMISR